MLPAVALNVAVVDPAATVTDAGTVRAALSDESPTVAPPVFDTVTVQVALLLGPKLDGVQFSPVTVTGATSPTVAVCWLPLSVAVSVAV